MDAPRSEHIAPLSVDVAHNVVWQGATLLRLTPKACAVLQYLMARQDGRVPGGCG
jgi:DNA-binding response OmpR family regulator